MLSWLSLVELISLRCFIGSRETSLLESGLVSVRDYEIRNSLVLLSLLYVAELVTTSGDIVDGFGHDLSILSTFGLSDLIESI